MKEIQSQFRNRPKNMCQNYRFFQQKETGEKTE